MATLKPYALRNPKTNRPVKVGSRMWRTLVKEGCLSSENFVDYSY